MKSPRRDPSAPAIGWLRRYLALPYGHNIPWEHPEELTKILLEYGD